MPARFSRREPILPILGESVFEQAERWLQNFDATKARRLGLQNRLIVPSSYTRKYLLYHPSDLAMLGAAEDMARYWSAPLDPRSGELLAVASPASAMAAVNLAGHPTESYLGLQFCRTIGRPVAGTLVDSWAFYRDLFAVVDNDWFDLLWFKNLSIPDAARRSGIRQMVTGASGSACSRAIRKSNATCCTSILLASRSARWPEPRDGPALASHDCVPRSVGQVCRAADPGSYLPLVRTRGPQPGAMHR